MGRVSKNFMCLIFQLCSISYDGQMEGFRIGKNEGVVVFTLIVDFMELIGWW